eukprot:764344-Pleurochrysis_carterae.AAC.1
MHAPCDFAVRCHLQAEGRSEAGSAVKRPFSVSTMSKVLAREDAKHIEAGQAAVVDFTCERGEGG